MSKKHTRKPTPYYPPSWFEIHPTCSWWLGPLGALVAEKATRAQEAAR